MNKSLSLSQVKEKNKLNNDSVYIALAEIRFSDDRVLRLCNDSQDVTWRGEIWKAFPFDLGEIKESSGGATQELALSVSNTLRLVQSYVEQSKGGIDTEVILRIVNTETLDEPIPLVEEIFGVTNTDIDDAAINFSLGLGFPMFPRFPERRFLKNFCEFEYGGIECAASAMALGLYPECNRTLSDCEKRANQLRFGGEISMGQGGFYAES